MSETLRTYSGGGLGRPRRKRRGSIRGLFRLLVFLVLLGAGGYAWWISRDTYAVGQVMPPHQKYWLAVQDIAGKRQKLVQSDVMKSLAQVIDLDRLNQILQQEIPVPQWVVNNLAGQTCYITGNDLQQFGDALVISKMTRLGTLIERFHSWLSGAEIDYAGGLRLKRLPDQEIFYASRGRVLLISPDRQALIRALTLPTTMEPANGQSWDAHNQSGAEDLQGRVSLEPQDVLGQWVEGVSFALRIDTNNALLKWRASLRPDVQQHLAPLVEDAERRPLLAPPDGLLTVSADFGKPVEEVWSGLAQAFGSADWAEKAWADWRTMPKDGAPGLSQMLTAVLEGRGPGIRLSLYGVDLNELFPVPEIVGIFESAGRPLEKVYAEFPPVPAQAKAWESFVRYDQQSKRMHLPMFGGPSLQPTAIEMDRFLLVSTSSSVADQLQDQPPPKEPLPKPGNLYIRVKPDACVDAVAGAGRLFTEIGALRGYTAESFDEAVKVWTEKAASVEELSALVSIDNGEVLGELTLATRLPQTDRKSGAQAVAAR